MIKLTAIVDRHLVSKAEDVSPEVTRVIEEVDAKRRVPADQISERLGQGRPLHCDAALAARQLCQNARQLDRHVVRGRFGIHQIANASTASTFGRSETIDRQVSPLSALPNTLPPVVPK